MLSQYAHDVVLASLRCRFNVMDIVWTSKRSRVLTGIVLEFLTNFFPDQLILLMSTVSDLFLSGYFICFEVNWTVSCCLIISFRWWKVQIISVILNHFCDGIKNHYASLAFNPLLPGCSLFWILFIRGQSVTQWSMGREVPRYPPQYPGP